MGNYISQEKCDEEKQKRKETLTAKNTQEVERYTTPMKKAMATMNCTSKDVKDFKACYITKYGSN